MYKGLKLKIGCFSIGILILMILSWFTGYYTCDYQYKNWLMNQGYAEYAMYRGEVRFQLKTPTDILKSWGY